MSMLVTPNSVYFVCQRVMQLNYNDLIETGQKGFLLKFNMPSSNPELERRHKFTHRVYSTRYMMEEDIVLCKQTCRWANLALKLEVG